MNRAGHEVLTQVETASSSMALKGVSLAHPPVIHQLDSVMALHRGAHLGSD